MGATLIRTGDAGQNFQQTIEGETPCSVTVSTNAKGQAQIEVKLYFANPNDVANLGAAYMSAAIKNLRNALTELGIPLAGQEGR